VEVFGIQELHVQVGNLEFTARRGRKRLGAVDHAIVVEVEPDDGVIRFRSLGLFDDFERPAFLIEVDDSVSLWVIDPITEDRRAIPARRSAQQSLGQTVSVEDVVAEGERDSVAANEVLSDQERLGETFGSRLYCVTQLDPEVGSVSEQTLKGLLVVGGGDDQDG